MNEGQAGLNVASYLLHFVSYFKVQIFAEMIFFFQISNGTARFKKNVSNSLNTKINSYLETSNGQSSKLYANVVHFFNASVN
jgi:hypothetical protein